VIELLCVEPIESIDLCQSQSAAAVEESLDLGSSKQKELVHLEFLSFKINININIAGGLVDEELKESQSLEAWSCIKGRERKHCGSVPFFAGQGILLDDWKG